MISNFLELLLSCYNRFLLLGICLELSSLTTKWKFSVNCYHISLLLLFFFILFYLLIFFLGGGGWTKADSIYIAIYRTCTECVQNIYHRFSFVKNSIKYPLFCITLEWYKFKCTVICASLWPNIGATAFKCFLSPFLTWISTLMFCTHVVLLLIITFLYISF